MRNYYLIEDGQRLGPFNLKELRRRFLSPQSMVWKEGMADWAPADSLPELTELFQTSTNLDQGYIPPIPKASDDPFQMESPSQDFRGGQRIGPVYGKVYKTYPQHADLSPEQIAHFARHNLDNELNVAVGLVLHFITLGLFTFFHLSAIHGKLPKVESDDPDTVKAIGFMFIPFFQLYWLFFFYTRLSRRLNFQHQLRKQRPRVSRGLAITFCIISIIPYLNFFGFFFLVPLWYGQVQSSINALVRERYNGVGYH